MRFNLTFLFLVSLQSFVLSNIEDSGNYIAKKYSHKIGQIKEKATTIATKEIHELLKFKSIQIFEPIHQHIQYTYSFGKNLLATKKNNLIVTLKSITRIKDKIDFSCQFISAYHYQNY